MRCNLFFLSLLIYACDLSLPYKNYIDKVCFLQPARRELHPRSVRPFATNLVDVALNVTRSKQHCRTRIP